MTAAVEHKSTATLWRNADFMRLWMGQTISELGSRVSSLALPLIAITTVQASDFEVSTIAGTVSLPAIAISLYLGVLVDRVRRRPLLIIAHAGRAVTLLTVPLAIWQGWLTLAHLYAAAFLMGVFNLLFQVANSSYLPTLIDRDQLADGNGKLAATGAAASVGGNTVGGALIAAIGTAWGIVADVATYVVAGLLLGSIRKPEERPRRSHTPRNHVHRDIVEGFRLVTGHPVLRALTCAAVVANLAYAMVTSVFTLFMYKTLGLTAAAMGIVFAVGNAGMLLGSVLPRWTTRRIGIGPTVVLAAALAAIGESGLALSDGRWALGVLAVCHGLYWVSVPLFNVPLATLYQNACPQHLQGRLNATVRFVTLGIFPIGAVLAGVLSEAYSSRLTLVTAGVIAWGAPLLLALSSARRVRTADDLTLIASPETDQEGRKVTP
ncbi:MFS transporter [Streptomyces sp. NPDC088789]|uniref:MFS transporter n=1 Tax=Streptomyces sp. NPDC088789 TaxID=3365899 RepID=UPI0037F84237